MSQRFARFLVADDDDLAGPLLDGGNLYGLAIGQERAVQLGRVRRRSGEDDRNARELRLRLVPVVSAKDEFGGCDEVVREIELGAQEVDLLGNVVGERDLAWKPGSERAPVERDGDPLPGAPRGRTAT